MGIKPSDLYTVGLCRAHHREAECNERAFQDKYGVDLLALAFEYAAQSPDRAVREAAIKLREVSGNPLAVVVSNGP